MMSNKKRNENILIGSLIFFAICVFFTFLLSGGESSDEKYPVSNGNTSLSKKRMPGKSDNKNNGIMNISDIVKLVQPSVVVVNGFKEGRSDFSLGSGFFIDLDGDIITNYHVVNGCDSANIKTYDRKIYKVIGVIGENAEEDLIELSVGIPHDEVSFLSIDMKTPAVGDKVVVIGNPLGFEQTVSDGILSAVRELPDLGKMFQITAPISPGSSGSPVVNMKGKVIGVASLTVKGGENINFAIPIEKLKDLRKVDNIPLKNMHWKKGKYEKGSIGK